ncbi:MAG: aminoglycoside 6-adenylyltransferase [Tissierellia bacterium]|nr:aminoglycoside 6-adenylyltransferase [Tissierellia bacterium]
MRDNTTIMSLILDIAKNDTRIRAVFQTGSRVNPLSSRDAMMDYDIIYCVREVEDFIADDHFLEPMGEAIMIHRPDSLKTLGRVPSDTYTYNCLFLDGIRVDFTFYPVEKISTLITTETLLMLLMDKDNLIQQLPVSSDVGYRTSRPTKNEFEEATGEFFYCVIEFVKYLVRQEEVAAFEAYQDTMDMLNRMTSWYAANEKDYKINVGKHHRYLVKNLDAEYIQMYRKSFPSLNITAFWQSLLTAMTLYRKLGLILADRLGYTYPKQLDVRVNAYIRSLWAQAQKTLESQ